MIGVIAELADRDVVREFFELFKTPWEFYHRDGQYDVLLCAGDGQFDATAKLVLLYASRKIHFDEELKIQAGHEGKHPCILAFHGNRIPIYGDTITFPEKRNGLLAEEDSKECAAFLNGSRARALARIGYDLFSEIRTLLTVGQPPANAHIPTLELHIAFLRDLITGCGISLTEIPPVPDGYRFIACLSHDVDHPLIRRHKWDHTIFGFLYRATLGSLHKLIRGQMPVRDLLANWAALLKLPFVYLGMAKDFWCEFDDRYLELEKGIPSTFFVIPFKDYSGKGPSGPAPAFRAARYGAQDIAGTIRKLTATGHEVGLHGIDAWNDSSKGSEELQEIRRLTGVAETGVRMHWLYYDNQSPAILEKAGAAYDSTIGYNETVGYRAGTTQAFKPLETRLLLELPMHVMDTALFYRGHLDLSPQQAKAIIGQMLDNAVQFGGALTVNWHDRSVVPERLWNACYRDLIQGLNSRGAWFSTVGQAVAWFRKRRSVVFETDDVALGGVRLRVADDHADNLPGVSFRIHKPGDLRALGTHRSDDYVDASVGESVVTSGTNEAK